MILQISERDSLVLKCHIYDDGSEMVNFYISIHENHLFISRNSGEEMKVHLGETKKTYLPIETLKDGKKNFSELIKSGPLKKGVVLIKLEKE